MTTPSDEEINKTIAEFVGEDGYTFHMEKGSCPKLFTHSLDALVPAWEKLNSRYPLFTVAICFLRERDEGKYIGWRCFLSEHELVADTIQQAAALATYKAIKELGKGNG